MLTTYQRLMDAGKVTRTGTVTYDDRPQDELVKQLQAEVEALRLRVRELTEGLRCDRREQEPRRGDHIGTCHQDIRCVQNGCECQCHEGNHHDRA